MDHKKNCADSFNRQAVVYDDSHYSKYPKRCYPHVLNALSTLRFSSILDLGCGTGSVLELLLAERPDLDAAAGLDLSSQMLAEAERKLRGKAVLTQGDAERLPYPDGRFDAVTCVASFHHYPHPETAIREVFRVLAPGGVFLVGDLYFKAPLRQLLTLSFRFGSSGDVRIYNEKEMLAMMAAAGFRQVRWSVPEKGVALCIGEK